MPKTAANDSLADLVAGQPEMRSLRDLSDIVLNEQSKIVTSPELGKLIFEETCQIKLIQIVEQRRFKLECLSVWLARCVPEFKVFDGGPPTVADDALAARVAVVMVSGDTLLRAPEYFEQNVAWLGPHRQSVPVVALMTDDMLDQSEQWIERFGLKGCIQESSTTEIASAILRLVAAGGTHFPRLTSATPATILLNQASFGRSNTSVARLTLRERAVVTHLGQGYPNKTIARELNMSLSTVKAHMHNIIQKLNARNRTEVAVLARAMMAGHSP
jgi:DNA-binding NarL/FixJ family response regulator